MVRKYNSWLNWVKNNPEMAERIKPLILEGAYRPKKLWQSVYSRCVSGSTDCFISREWMDYLTFLEWYDKNFVPFYELDKDIILEGNKTYSAETCAFVPLQLNRLFRSSKGEKSTGLPGVKYSGKHFIAISRVGGTHVTLGKFTSKEEAYKIVLLNKYLYALEILEEFPCKDPRVVASIKNRLESLDFSV